ncbi:ankyrin repeat-containing domain protein [Tuber brumale]|nr:ankyrin repeat-containing domain protein [Tuber brumale]
MWKWYNPLGLAASKGNPTVVRLLMQDPRVDVNMFDVSGGNPLLNGARSGELFVVRQLLADARVDVHVVDRDQESAIHIAARHRHPHTLRLLVEDGRIDVNALSGCGSTALELAIKCFWSGELRDGAVWEECVRCILSHKSFDPSTPNRWGATVLHVAVSFTTPGITRILLAEGRFDADTVNDAALNLPFSASPVKCNCLQELLRDSRLDVNYRNSDGETILHCAVRSRSVGILWVFLEDGRFDVNAVDDNMATPLHVAAGRVNDDVAWLLLTKSSGGGVDVGLKDCNGDTPLDVAVKGEFQETALVLQGQGPADKDEIMRHVNLENRPLSAHLERN